MRPLHLVPSVAAPPAEDLEGLYEIKAALGAYLTQLDDEGNDSTGQAPDEYATARRAWDDVCGRIERVKEARHQAREYVTWMASR